MTTIICKICDQKMSWRFCSECQHYERVNNTDWIFVVGFEMSWFDGIATIYKAPEQGSFIMLRRFPIKKLTPKLAKEWLERLKTYQVMS